MPIVLYGSLRRILMPDGNWLFKDAGGDASTWLRMGGWTLMGGTGTYNGSGGVYISFPYSFPNACVGATISEANASGWGGNSMTVYGASSITTSGMSVRGILKSSGSFSGPVQSGMNISFNWIAFGY